jgi:choline kinase
MMDSLVHSQPRRAIILSAGQGKRLLPHTADQPKCLIEIQGRAVIEHQIDSLIAAGFEHISIVVGYAAADVEQRLRERYQDAPVEIEPVFNPFFELADNLASCWMARTAMMKGDFLILNGDTLFELPVLERLLASSSRPITLAIDRKNAYDADDMKVILEGERLVRVGKKLDPQVVNGESIGMMIFRGEGSALFYNALERIMRTPEALSRWYLSVIDELAATGQVFTQSIEGLGWAELDFPHDLEQARRLMARWQSCDATTEAARD